ncbi:tetratricopeptide repeat-containing glycosyltransferase family protein [Thalassospira sp.]|uniref:tetratricopeptide repeat-containing glycosyltransferase family protein n=1 Tax=Thalassospira sp. TaxID=1912094 RepID=UPI002736F034|nr:tetratricopeptide repeat-containing glycosyltransferase family protein [Thalassospira sp.]MDP2700248.1 tetratricopeptide repeat-containing glycosyltransferase family protein [Thalassospira sp.]
MSPSGEQPGNTAVKTIRQEKKTATTNPASSGVGMFERALAAHQAGKLDEAIRLYGAILRQKPDQPDVLNNIGVALRRTKRFEAALAAYQRAATLRPGNAGLWTNMGNCLREMMRYDAAIVAHDRALELDPDTKTHPFNAGLVWRDLNRMDRAIDMFDRALAIDPDYIDGLWDRALAYLTQGDYGRGWPAYEVRRRLADNPIRPLKDVPEWDGKASLRGKTILLRAEQGFGDMIQFARFVPLVAKKAGHVILECRKELMPVMRTVAGVGSVLEKGAKPPAFDVHLPLLSLPYVLDIGETQLREVSQDAYLAPPENRHATIPVPAGAVLKVGIVWAGKLNPRDRSCPLERFLPLMTDGRAAFYSFQVDDRRADILRIGADAFVTDFGDHIHDFGDSAALMREMDLIITIDSAPAHLAGALGLPVWMLQLYTTDWRWMVGRTDSPWYPSMRLYRQEQPGDWDAPFARLQNDFTTLVAARFAATNSGRDASGA